VRDQHNRLSPPSQLLNPLEAPRLKRQIADRENLVKQENVRIKVRRYRKPKPNEHARWLDPAENPALISINAERRPRSVIVPSVGAVTRDNSFTRVVFPDPFGPMTPSASPLWTARVTSLSAHTSPRLGVNSNDRLFRRFSLSGSDRTLYAFETCSTLTSII
jgi:hypothetical protein